MTSPSATQARVLFAGAAIAYVLAVCNFLPVRVWPRMLITVALLIAGIWALAKLFSKKPPTGYGILAVQLTAAAILLLPTFPAMGGDGGAALPVSLAAVSMAGAVWASLRFEGRLEQHANRVPLRTAVWAGLFGALAVSAVATIPIALAFVAGAEEAMKLTLVYPAYLVGGLGAAVTYWLLQPVAHATVGALPDRRCCRVFCLRGCWSRRGAFGPRTN